MENDIAYSIIRSILDSVASRKSNGFPVDAMDMKKFLSTCSKELIKEPSCTFIYGEYVVVGDLHGDISSLLKIFKQMGYPPDTSYLFLGDYVDRGSNSLEVMTLLLALKHLFWNSFFLLKGNHETKSISRKYGFKEECSLRATLEIYEMFIDVFAQLPIAAVINDSIFCVHGGISENLKKASDLITINKTLCIDNRKIHKRPPKIIHDLLWNDPSRSINYFRKNGTRGEFFGEDALKQFLEKNNFSCLIRAHQCCENGYDNPFKTDNCWTVFSTANYCGMENMAGCLVVNEAVMQTYVFSQPKEFEHILYPSWLLEIDNEQKKNESFDGIYNMPIDEGIAQISDIVENLHMYSLA